MPPARRSLSNGPSPSPSPSAAKQRQITTFFSAGGKSPKDSPTSNPSSTLSKSKSRRKQAAPLDHHQDKNEEEEEEAPRKLRRLRRLSGASASSSIPEEKGEVDNHGGGDEDWAEDDDDDDDDDDSAEEVVAKRSTSGRGRSSSSCAGSSKRKKVDVDKLGCAKTFSFDGDGDGHGHAHAHAHAGGSSAALTSKNTEKGPPGDEFGSSLLGDVAERFGKREAEKFRFLRDGRKDARGRRPGEADYDPRTLYLPNDFLRSLSGGQRQWWEIKSKHMDKVLFFKMGKFYELFEMDAHIGARELDLQYMKGEQPHCGFPEKNYYVHLETLARKGYRVLVVEQTETPVQLERRRKETGSKDKVVKREICAVITKGTLTEGESLLTNPNSSYLISITEQINAFEDQIKEGIVIGICLVDASTSKFMVGQIEDDNDRHCLCSILSELRPVEIIKPSGLLSPETEKVLKGYTRNPLINNLIPSLEFWDAERTINEIRNIYRISMPHSTLELSSGVNGCTSSDPDMLENSSWVLPDVLSELVSAGQNGYRALSAFGGCLFYLRQAFLGEALLKCAKFERLPRTGFLNSVQNRYMILDAAALENLEILENNRIGGPSGTLFSQLDHCVTSFGKRLLKSWLARPLYKKILIVERQDAIAGFKGVGVSCALEFRKELARLPDMERLLSRLFATCEANRRNAKIIVLYEDRSKKQLQEFVAALRGCELMNKACSSLSSFLAHTESSLLHHLLTPGKGLPDISSLLKHFKDAFDWAEADRSGRIIPLEGGDSEYDTSCTALKEIESSLMSYLKEQRRLLRDASITYVTVGKDSYLLEVPESLRSSVPREYELCSSKKGYFRYWTPKIKKYLAELAQAEADRESKLKNIFQRLSWKFSEHHTKWRQLVSVIAELDVLISLSIASEYFEGPTCRPTVKETCDSSNNIPYLSAISLGHPVLRSDTLEKGSFVPNDVCIGGAGHASFILLTGPNMGGKSTLLRQVCMAVILAQIGADVPAESFELTSVDRIFVRMGARDLIMAGQSTFLMELSETASMLSSATQNSLVALDELGRGTSTSDGQAIAGSVLDYMVHKIQCRGLFSTHYHRLAVDYENDTKVSLSHMTCQVGKGIGAAEEVTFLYRLAPGSCPKSYGVNVARLAGIPPCVLEKAAAKSAEFEINYGRHKNAFKNEFSSLTQLEELSVFIDVLRVAKAINCHDNSEEISMSLLRQMQQRAKLLVLGK